MLGNGSAIGLTTRPGGGGGVGAAAVAAAEGCTAVAAVAAGAGADERVRTEMHPEVTNEPMVSRAYRYRMGFLEGVGDVRAPQRGDGRDKPVNDGTPKTVLQSDVRGPVSRG